MSCAVFVFGSNLAGRHGAGAAKEAYTNWGAVWGEGIGRHGNSYAIPTKDHNLRSLPLSEIQKYIDVFLDYARNTEHTYFILTPIGTGLAGYDPLEIRPMFDTKLSSNIYYPKEFYEC